MMSGEVIRQPGDNVCTRLIPDAYRHGQVREFGFGQTKSIM
jgi:hypothetical protein